MVFGDTIAVALKAARNLTKEEYAANHPAGRIGKSLIFKVKDVMKKKKELSVYLRRTLKASGEAIFKLSVGEMCNRKPRKIGPETMAVEAMKKMESSPSPVQFLPVVDEGNTLIRIITLHGLVSAGLCSRSCLYVRVIRISSFFLHKPKIQNIGVWSVMFTATE
ncbi:unnamed protein product [Brassica oleracea]